MNVIDPMFSTHIPLKFRFCADACSSCRERGVFLALPHDFSTQRNGLRFYYQCRKCSTKWSTWFDAQSARAHSEANHIELLREGLLSLDLKGSFSPQPKRLPTLEEVSCLIYELPEKAK